MIIKKPRSYNLTCPHCGTKILLTYDELKKYIDETCDYGRSTIVCQKEGVGDVDFINFDCPVCTDYIPVYSTESDRYGFMPSKNLEVDYSQFEEMKMDDYLENVFFAERKD